MPRIPLTLEQSQRSRSRPSDHAGQHHTQSSESDQTYFETLNESHLTRKQHSQKTSSPYLPFQATCARAKDFEHVSPAFEQDFHLGGNVDSEDGENNTRVWNVVGRWQTFIKEDVGWFCYLDGSSCLLFERNTPLSSPSFRSYARTISSFKVSISVTNTRAGIHNVRHRNPSSSPRRHDCYSEVTRRINTT